MVVSRPWSHCSHPLVRRVVALFGAALLLDIGRPHELTAARDASQAAH